MVLQRPSLYLLTLIRENLLELKPKGANSTLETNEASEIILSLKIESFSMQAL